MRASGILPGMDDRPVGMFDSGVGGLSVYRAFRDIAPSERVVYFADTAYFPYGPRTAAEVRKRAFAITHRLLEADVKMIVGNGYVPGHAAYAMDLLRTNEGVRDLFEGRL